MRKYIAKLFINDKCVVEEQICFRDAKFELKSNPSYTKCVIYSTSGHPISVCNRKDGYYYYTPAALEKPLENI